MSQYTTGTVRKTRREKEKELAEAKKKEEEERAAQAYAEFLDEFEGEGSSRAKSSQFVKAGQVESTSTPLNRPTGPRANRFEQRNVGDIQPLSCQVFIRAQSPPLDSASRPKGKRAMDAFLEEIKR